MKKLLHALLLASTLTHTYAQQDTIRTTNRSAGLVFLTNVVSFLPSAMLVMSIHETGHVSFAKLFGAKNARWGIYRRTPEGGTAYGWADYDKTNLSSLGLAFTNIGGVLFSRGWAEGSDYFVSTVHTPAWVQQFFSMTFLMARIDFPRYVLQDALINLFDSKGSDIDEFVTALAGRNTGRRTLAYTALLAVAVVDLVYDWP